MAYQKAFPLYSIVSFILAVGLCLMAYFLLGFPVFISVLLGVGLWIVALFSYVVYRSIEAAWLTQASKTRLATTRPAFQYEPENNPYLSPVGKPSQAVAQPTVSRALSLSGNDNKVDSVDNQRVGFPSPHLGAEMDESTDALRRDPSLVTLKRKGRDVIAEDQALSLTFPPQYLAEDRETKPVVHSNEAQAFQADLNDEEEEEDEAVLRAAKALSLAQPEAPTTLSTAIPAQQRLSSFHDTTVTDDRIKRPDHPPLFADPMEDKRRFSSENPASFLTQAEADATDPPPFCTSAEADALAFQIQYWEIEEGDFSETRSASSVSVAQAIHVADLSEEEDAELQRAKVLSLTRVDDQKAVSTQAAIPLLPTAFYSSTTRDQAVHTEDIKRHAVNRNAPHLPLLGASFYEETAPPRRVESKVTLPEAHPAVKRYLEAHSRGPYRNNPTRLLHVIQEAKAIDDMGEEEIGIIVQQAIALGADVSEETMTEWDDSDEVMKRYDALEMANKRGYREVVTMISEKMGCVR